MPLLIDDKKVQNISGPVSMYILYPNDDYLREFPYAPIYILFSDAHFGSGRYCSNDDTDNNIIHFYVFDKEFLQLFSNEVGVDGVDLYLEAGGKTHDFSKENENETKSTSGELGPMFWLWGLFRECYSNTRMGRVPAKDSGCGDIKNIRWQSSDIRFFGQYKAYNFVDDNLNFHVEESDVYFEKFKKLIMYPKFKAYKDIILLTQEEFINKYLYGDESLIVKQLKKIKDESKRRYLITEFENYIIREYGKVEKPQLEKFMNLKDAMIRMSNNDYSDEYNKAYEDVKTAFSTGLFTQYRNWCELLFSVLPDLYILARSHKYMAKTNEDDSKEEIKYPLVNIVYYGDYHVNNLVNFLGSKWYTVKENFSNLKDGKIINDKIDDFRCIFIPEGKTIDLNAMITQLKTRRSEAITQEKQKSGGKHKRRTK